MALDGHGELSQDPRRCGILETALIAFALPLVVLGNMAARLNIPISTNRSSDALMRIGYCLQRRIV
jgi:hypothetical protein